MDVEPPSGQPPRACPRWPPRTQRLIGEVLGICDNWLHEPLQLCLGDFDVRLHDRAEHTRSHLDQQRYLTTRERLLQERQTFDQRFIASVHRSFDALGSGATATRASASQPLSLLDPVAHELTAALDQLVARSAARGGQVMVELGYRLAVLVGVPPLEGEALPLGPQAMALAFGDACKALSLPGDHELVLVQSLESSLMQRLGPLYDLVNAHLLADGILPQLRAFSLPRAPARPARAPTSIEQTPAQPAVAAEPAGTESPAAAESGIPSPGVRAATPATPVLVSADELQAAIAQLQQANTQSNPSAAVGFQAVRDTLLRQLNAGRASGAEHAALSTDQAALVEQVAVLFESASRQLTGADARYLLGGLQWPLLRMAVFDRHVIEQRDHPARCVLDRITEALRDWVGDDDDGEVDHGLRARVGLMVERAGREPPSATLYASLLVEIEQHLALLQRKAMIAERRHVEAMQGRELLTQARHRTADLMAERFALAPPRGLLRPLLERAWSDVLALTLLRHGENSEAFATRLVITDQLLGRLPAGDRQRLQREVESGLQQIGMHVEEVSQITQALVGGGTGPAAADAASMTSLAVRLKQRQRLGDQVAGVPPAGPVATGPGPGSPEQRLLQRLREMPLGSWFEFVDPANGKLRQRRLAWYSPVSGHSLFVTRRGQRASEMTLQELADEIASGHVRAMQRGLVGAPNQI